MLLQFSPLVTTITRNFYRIARWFHQIKGQVKWRFASLKIRVKLIIIIALLVTSFIAIFSFILIQNGKHILNERLSQTCELSLRHVSQAIKEDLLLYYKSLAENDFNSRSGHVGHIREAVLEVNSEDIEGLVYAGVVDRHGQIIAHTNLEHINKKIEQSDSLEFASLSETVIRENGPILEYIRPMYAKRDAERSVYLGVTMLGFSKNVILQPINQATQMIVTATFFIALLATVIIFFVASRMTRQIDALGIAVRKVSEGNLKVDIPILSNDELGQLAREFSTMIVHLREKLQMQKFVSSLTVQMIRKRSLSDLPPVGERREVTVLFSDVRSFSTLTERLGPEEIVRLINIYLDLQARIIEENNGILDKFMGDQVMAIFLGETQADDAVHTAVEIQRSIRELNKRRSRGGELVLNIGIGINIGLAVMGNMGSKNRLDYTVIGDVVNLASRLCALAQPGQIIAPVEMAERLTGEYPTIRLNPIWVKGRSQPVATFEIDYDHAIIM